MYRYRNSGIALKGRNKIFIGFATVLVTEHFPARLTHFSRVDVPIDSCRNDFLTRVPSIRASWYRRKRQRTPLTKVDGDVWVHPYSSR